MTMWAIIQTKSVPNLSNFVPYDYLARGFLLIKEIWSEKYIIVVLGHVNVHIFKGAKGCTRR